MKPKNPPKITATYVIERLSLVARPSFYLLGEFTAGSVHSSFKVHWITWGIPLFISICSLLQRYFCPITF